MSRGRSLQNCNTQRHRQTDRRSHAMRVCSCMRVLLHLSLSLSLSLFLRMDCTLIPALYTRIILSTRRVIRAIFCVCIVHLSQLLSPTITPAPHQPSPTHLSQSGGTFSIDIWFDMALSASFFRFCDAMCRVYFS